VCNGLVELAEIVEDRCLVLNPPGQGVSSALRKR
jgi:hypothetical protein